jgi:hypothetical protein
MSGAHSDDALLRAFESCDLPTAEFSHREHLRVAWLYVRAMPFADAASRFCAGLKRFAAAKGASAKYNETITWAYLALLNERANVDDAAPTFDAFIAANADLLDHKGGALATLYDRTVLESELARRVFLLPRKTLTA